MLNFEVKVSQRYFIWLVLRLWGVLMTQTVQQNGLSVQQRVVQSAGLYCEARLLIDGNYWYAGLSVCGELFSRQTWIVLLGRSSAEITGTLGSQSSGKLFNLRPCTMPLDCWVLIHGNYWYPGLSVRGEYWSKDQLELKFHGQYCSDRLFSTQYCTSGAVQR